MAFLHTHIFVLLCIPLAFYLGKTALEHMRISNLQRIFTITKCIEPYVKRPFHVNHGQVNFSVFSGSLTCSVLYDPTYIVLPHTNEISLVQNFISQSNCNGVNTSHFQCLRLKNGCLEEMNELLVRFSRCSETKTSERS